MKDYIILNQSSEVSLQQEVNKYLSQGYLCLGAPFTISDGYRFYQAIYRPLETIKTENNTNEKL